MKLFTIAKETSECYGHGDFGTEQRICKTGDYGSGDFPPLFSNPEKAQEWIDKQKWSYGMVVVEMTFID